MNRKRKRNFSVNGNQQGEFGMNDEQQGGYNMKGAPNMSRKQTRRTIENHGRGTETVGPKGLSAIYPGKDPNNDPKERLYGAVGIPAKEWLSDESIENLDGGRFSFVVIVGQTTLEDGYQGRKVRMVWLKSVEMEGSGKRLRNQRIAPGNWSQGIGRGDVIVFDATLKDGKLKYPTNVRIRKSASKTGGPKSGSSGTDREWDGSGVPMEIPF